jgi:sugar phosphate isomerase/epimerase
MTTWRYSVGEYTTPHLAFAEDLATYWEAGAEGIGIDEGLKLRDPVEDLARFKESGLEATFCFPAVSTVFAGALSHGPRDPQLRIAELCRGIERLAAYEPVCCVCGSGPGAEDGDARRLVVEGLREAARVASSLGLRVALEPLHASKRDVWSSITTIPGAISLLDEIGAPNFGLVVDVWHLWDTPGVTDHLRANAERIYGVHVNDWRDPTRSWCDRVLPGDGIANVTGILGALAAGGYRGWLELEVFSDDGLYGDDFEDSLWKEDPVDLIRRGRDRIASAWVQGCLENGVHD